MRQIFAIGVGGTGAKCVEALVHLHASGLLAAQNRTPARLGVFLVEPDQQSALLSRAQIAISRYTAVRNAVGRHSDSFARAELRDYGQWSPLTTSTGAITLDTVFPKAVLQTKAPGVAALFDCLFPPEEQIADLDIGFRGRPPIGSAVMSRIDLKQEAQSGQWQQMLTDIETAAGGGEPPLIHLFGSVFGGTGASGVPTLGRLLKNWLSTRGLEGIHVQSSLLLPYFDFDGVADDGTGVHAESRNFQLNTDAALQYLRTSGDKCFDRVFLVGSDIKARYDFSIGGVSQSNAANLVELLAALAVRHPHSDDGVYAHVISRSQKQCVSWEDLPDDERVGKALARAARFAVAWKNNFTREIEDAQNVPVHTFISGAPWARRFFNLGGTNSIQGGLPGIRDQNELTIQSAIDEYCDTLLQWLNQLSSNLGDNFQQQMLTTDELVTTDHYVDDLSRIVQGKARPQRSEADTVENIKVRIDSLLIDEIGHKGIAGLADCIWTQVI